MGSMRPRSITPSHVLLLYGDPNEEEDRQSPGELVYAYKDANNKRSDEQFAL
jgi:hypothetical protein